jgi:hypothetical protein
MNDEPTPRKLKISMEVMSLWHPEAKPQHRALWHPVAREDTGRSDRWTPY